MQANKTPFEVRLDILKMAQEMLDRETDIKQNAFNAKLDTIRNDPKSSADSINAFIDTHSPKMYEPSEVVARSTALYSFVNDTSKSQSK
jgi:hypothetical protein